MKNLSTPSELKQKKNKIETLIIGQTNEKRNKCYKIKIED